MLTSRPSSLWHLFKSMSKLEVFSKFLFSNISFDPEIKLDYFYLASFCFFVSMWPTIITAG